MLLSASITHLRTCRQYRASSHAKQGDRGSESLAPGVAGVASWHKGERVNVSWSITANHGGGYQVGHVARGGLVTCVCSPVPAILYCTVLYCTILQYRLCPADQELTEECFQKMPLEFVGQQGFVWGDGAEHWFTGTYVRWSCVVLGIVLLSLYTLMYPAARARCRLAPAGP